MRQPVSLAHASRLLNHGPTVLVCSRDGRHRNVMAAAWSMPVEFTPPRVAVVIDKSTWTAELVAASGELALCVPGRALADATFAVGSVTGRDGPDKFTRYGLETFPGPALGLPLVEGCGAWLEGRVIVDLPGHAMPGALQGVRQAYDTVFVEVVSALADDRVFRDGRWSFRDDNQDLHTLHHLGAGAFAVAAQTVQASLPKV